MLAGWYHGVDGLANYRNKWQYTQIKQHFSPIFLSQGFSKNSKMVREAPLYILVKYIFSVNSKAIIIMVQAKKNDNLNEGSDDITRLGQRNIELISICK